MVPFTIQPRREGSLITSGVVLKGVGGRCGGLVLTFSVVAG